ncbi:unnamed protein product [Symbiodinium sp. CCMP2592]|nr:unnamed protein product [Symbiodinium sp. CCMP2592]CAE7569940.1 unnamed protein product [Symbiodinium sp. CCMP2592]
MNGDADAAPGFESEPGTGTDSVSDSDLGLAAPIVEEEVEEEDEGLVDSDNDAGHLVSTISRAPSDVTTADPVPVSASVGSSAGSPRSMRGAGEDEGEAEGHESASFDCDHESQSSGEVHTSHPGQGDAAAGVGSSDAVALERYVMNKEWVKFLPSDLTDGAHSLSSPFALVSPTVHMESRDDLELELENLMETIYCNDPVDSVDSENEAHDACHMGNAWAA